MYSINCVDTEMNGYHCFNFQKNVLTKFLPQANKKVSNFHFGLSLKRSQGEVHDFSGEVQKFLGEVQNDLRGGAHLPTKSSHAINLKLSYLALPTCSALFFQLEGQGSNTTGQPSSEENPENKRKKSHTSSQNPNDRSFLSWIMSALCRGGGSTSDSDEASNKIDSNGASTSKQDSPRTRSKGTSKKGNRSPVMLELEDLDDSKSRKTDKDLKNGSVAKSDSSVVNSQRTPTDVDPLKPKTKTGQLAGIGRDKGEGGKGKNKSNSKSAKRGDCSRNCTGRACKRCGAFKNNDDDDGGYDDDDGNNDGGNYELLAKRRTDQGSSKHEKQGARKDEGRGRSDKRSEAVAHQTRSQANPGKKSGMYNEWPRYLHCLAGLFTKLLIIYY